MAMTDSDPPDSSTAGKPLFGSLFGLARRRSAKPTGDDSLNGVPEAPSEMRLRLTAFEQGTVSNVMIPRADIIAVEVNTGLDDVIQMFAKEAHSRLPVYRETLDDPLGFVHIKDVVAEIAREDQIEQSPTPLERLHRDMLYVPASMPLADLLVKMQTSRIHLALVVDEYGGTDGLVSLEDLVEEIVGEIEDEHDEASVTVLRKARNTFEVDARMEIENFADETGHDLSLIDFEDEIDTLGGVAFALAGRIPVRGEVLRHPSGFDIEIVDGDSRRIRRLRLRASPSPQTDGPETTA